MDVLSVDRHMEPTVCQCDAPAPAAPSPVSTMSIRARVSGGGASCTGGLVRRLHPGAAVSNMRFVYWEL